LFCCKQAFDGDNDYTKDSKGYWTVGSEFGVRPLKCVLWQFAIRYLWFVLIVGGSIGTYFYMQYRRRRNFRDKQNVDTIVQKVMIVYLKT